MIYKFAIVFSIVLILFIINLVKKSKLDEKYSILWLLASFIILIVSRAWGSALWHHQAPTPNP